MSDTYVAQYLFDVPQLMERIVLLEAHDRVP